MGKTALERIDSVAERLGATQARQDKLPVWAQRYITVLRREVNDYDKAFREMEDPDGNIQITDPGSTGSFETINAPGRHVRVLAGNKGDRYRGYVDVHRDSDGVIQIRTSGACSIMPGSSNAFQLEVQR